MEDFFTAEYLSQHISKICETEYQLDASKSAIDNIKKATAQNKEKSQDIKNSLINELDKKEDIKKEYSDFIEILEKKITKK